MNLFGLDFLFYQSCTTGTLLISKENLPVPANRRLSAEKRPLDDFSETLSTSKIFYKIF